MSTTIENAAPEAEFLDSRAREARAGVSGSLAALPRSLEHAVSPRAWTARFPWAATGATVLGVFALAVAIDRRLARPPAAPQHVAARQSFTRAAAECPVRRAGLKTARLARGTLHRFVVQPLRAALMAHLRGLF